MLFFFLSKVCVRVYSGSWLMVGGDEGKFHQK